MDSRHITWFGTHNGISCLSSEGWEMYLAADFFEIYNDNVQDVAVGNDTVYFATMGGGVTRLRYDVDAITTASPVNTWNFIASDTVYSVFVDSKSVKWFGTNHGVSRLQGSDQRIFPNWITYTTDSVYASVVHKGIPDDTVYVIQGDGLADNTVQAICEDSDGNMWFGTPTGVTRFDGNTWKTFTIKDGLASNDVRDIAVNSKGEVWCATKSGVSKFVKEPAKVILAQTQIPHFLAVSSYPNPFNMETNIKIILPQSEFVRVDIYDILGKKIKTLVQNQLSAGPNLLKWDGKNDRGVSVTSGVYIVQLVSKTCVSTTKIVVAK